MTASVSAPQSLRPQLQSFIEQEGIELVVVARGGRVRIVRKSRVTECDVRTLRLGGWIPCSAAWAVAKRLSIPVPAVGRLLNHLGVKVRRCELGCFS